MTKNISEQEKLRVSNFIKVDSEPIYIDEESEPDNNQYFWAYHITISNQSKSQVTLRHRHWVITDANGVQCRVNGKGVVGKQPDLKPGESFSYTSGAMLHAPSGVMAGHYDVETADGHMVSVVIPAFSLDSPHQLRTIN